MTNLEFLCQVHLEKSVLFSPSRATAALQLLHVRGIKESLSTQDKMHVLNTMMDLSGTQQVGRCGLPSPPLNGGYRKQKYLACHAHRGIDTAPARRQAPHILHVLLICMRMARLCSKVCFELPTFSIHCLIHIHHSMMPSRKSTLDLTSRKMLDQPHYSICIRDSHLPLQDLATRKVFDQSFFSILIR